MIKKKLIKSLALGMCLMTLTTGSVVSAAEINRGETTTKELRLDQVDGVEMSIEPYAISYEVSESEEALLKLQREIEQYVFVDRADEIGTLGFTVTNIGIIKDKVEVGIISYSDEAANYLYEKFGKDSIQVVEGMIAELYTTTVATAPDTPVSGGGSQGYVGEGVILEDGQFGITSIDEKALDTPVSSDVVTDAKLYKEGDVAITSDNTEQLEATYDPAIAEVSIVKADEKKEDSSNLLIALVAGGAAILLGGIAFAVRKLRLKK